MSAQVGHSLALPDSSRTRDPEILTVAVETQGSVLQGGTPAHHKVEGIGVSFVPRTFDRECCDEIMMVNDPEAFAMVKRLAVEEGVLAGSSGGAAIEAAVHIATRLGPGKRVATIIPDSAERYLSKKIFEGGLMTCSNPGCRAHGFSTRAIHDGAGTRSDDRRRECAHLRFVYVCAGRDW